MKKLLLILLCLPFIGFGQDSKSYFTEPFIADYKTLQIQNNQPNMLDGVTMVKGKIILTDNSVTIITNKNKLTKVDADTSILNTYIYDITEIKNITKLSFKLKEKINDYKTRLSYTSFEGQGSFVIESIDEFNNNQTTTTYILKEN